MIYMKGRCRRCREVIVLQMSEIAYFNWLTYSGVLIVSGLCEDCLSEVLEYEE